MRYAMTLLYTGVLVSAAALADPIIFPAQGQSAEQQEKDKFELLEGKQKIDHTLST